MKKLGKLTKKIINCNHRWQEYNWFNVQVQRPNFTMHIRMFRCKKCGVIKELFATHHSVNGHYVPNSLMVGRLGKTPQRVSRGESVDVSSSLTSAPKYMTTYTTDPKVNKYY